MSAPGALKIQGSTVKYVDAQGRVWAYPAEYTASVSDSAPVAVGAIYVYNGFLRFVDSAGQRRQMTRADRGPTTRGAGDLRIEAGHELRYAYAGRLYQAHMDAHTDYHEDRAHEDSHIDWYVDSGPEEPHNDRHGDAHSDSHDDLHDDVHADAPVRSTW